MDASNPWFFVVSGFIAIFVSVGAVRLYRARKLFKASFYTEIYSGFFEYNLRRKSLKRLATSNWLHSQFGEHRIFFQMAQSKKGDSPQAYLLIVLQSGVYTILCKNYVGKFIEKNKKFEVKSQTIDKKTKVVNKSIRKVSDPIVEIEEFNQRWKKFSNTNYNEHNIVVFSDECEIVLEEEKKYPFINRNKLFDTIKKMHEQSKEVMSDDEIVALYNVFMKKTKS